MPHIRSTGKVQVEIYLEPDVFQTIDAQRNPKTSRAEFYAMNLKRAFGITA